MRTVAALCVSGRSIYKHLAGVVAYDEKKDARTFPGGMPIIAHPPCRSWSAFTRHQAKPAPGEKELGLWCCQQVRQWGGVLEQPAHSHLWQAAGLPLPSRNPNPDAWSCEVWQAWWGYPMRKATWLFFSHINPKDIRLPFLLHSRGFDRDREQQMGSAARSRTMPEFAKWLVAAARCAKAPAIRILWHAMPNASMSPAALACQRPGFTGRVGMPCQKASSAPMSGQGPSPQSFPEA